MVSSVSPRKRVRPAVAGRRTLAVEQCGCNLCQSDQSKRLFAETYRLDGDEVELGIRQCRNCGLVYVSPRLTPESVANVYRLDTATTISHEYCWAGNSDAPRFQRLLKRLEQLRPSGRLVDVGCGAGQLLAEGKQIGGGGKCWASSRLRRPPDKPGNSPDARFTRTRWRNRPWSPKAWTSSR